jgi:hypothetical protein
MVELRLNVPPQTNPHCLSAKKSRIGPSLNESSRIFRANAHIASRFQLFRRRFEGFPLQPSSASQKSPSLRLLCQAEQAAEAVNSTNASAPGQIGSCGTHRKSHLGLTPVAVSDLIR